MQLFCNSTKGIAEFIKKNDKQVSLWDFNLGCPVFKAKKEGYGAYLTDLKTIEEILKTIKSSTKKPVTIKIRKSEIAFKLLELAEKYCDAIAVHPRTKEQGYSGKPDVEFALQIKKKSKIPVIYSGNANGKNYKDLLEKFDFVMVGRASIGHPEIFAELTGNKKFKRSVKDYLKLAVQHKLSHNQIKFQVMNFTKGLRNSRKLRVEINRC